MGVLRVRAGRTVRRAVLVLLASLLVPLATAAPAAAAGGPVYVNYVYYYVDDIYGHYDGTYDNSTGYGTTCPASSSCLAAITEGMSYSNTWGASLTFVKSAVQAKVSYDVTFSSSRSFTATYTVPAGKSGTIRYRDHFHVTQMHVHKQTCPSMGNCYAPVYGTAWAAQWYWREFYIVIS